MENKINVTVDSLVNINGMTEEHVESLIACLKGQSSGFNTIKSYSFSEQNKVFKQLQPELAKLSNSELRKVIDVQLKQGQDCEDILIALEAWKKENKSESITDKVDEINSKKMEKK